jgi:hypothetical protein
MAKKVNYKTDPVQVWYPALWKQKVAYNFYEVHNAFVSSFKRLIYGPNTSRLSLEAASFLARKGSFEAMDDFSIIRLYCSHEKPSLLPFYVSDRLFIVEVCKQYKFWAHFFNEKRKKQFIPLPWKIGEITMKSISHLDETSTHFDLFNLKQANEIKGFDPNQLFMTHMTSVGYNMAFSKTFYLEKEKMTIKIFKGCLLKKGKMILRLWSVPMTITDNKDGLQMKEVLGPRTFPKKKWFNQRKTTKSNPRTKEVFN